MRLSINRNPHWIPFSLSGTDADLLSYYQESVSHKLIGMSNPQVQSLAFRMSFSDDSVSASAIRYAILALAAIYLFDRQRAVAYSKRATTAIRDSLVYSTTNDILQRIVASNFLTMFETLLSPDDAPKWATNICFSKTASITSFTLDQKYHGDSALILEWVCYYVVLSKFSLRHFDRPPMSSIWCVKQDHLKGAVMNSFDANQILPIGGCSMGVLMAISTTISEVMRAEIGSDIPLESLDKLERQLKYARQEIRVEDIDDVTRSAEATELRSTAELYRLAGLIYLERAGRKVSPSNARVQQYVNDAFSILDGLHVCGRTLPLFIISCEASTDSQKATILRLLSSTKHHYGPCNIVRVHNFIERFWAMNELDSDQDLGYTEKMTDVLSLGDSLPAFV
ncbi:hypothetical protein BU24DRAFT_424063 [Aaosphaeria arxii CBS 175.79]|uniref:Uncharacterized protein n=1 Tax=Aaosphaeria arxii CBS 175.79 TaxID=1450172 RepID=A0A6A5XQH4_9PLEO|nr:uncharacterized protein BU24DRAFT_424063 [Aaosphaeria arxii CBS 175.79]KAF2015183.1 hypothetical protein BU24DRAFT_424063 [Aaosphaeria arxii CBS 175.79]